MAAVMIHAHPGRSHTKRVESYEGRPQHRSHRCCHQRARYEWDPTEKQYLPWLWTPSEACSLAFEGRQMFGNLWQPVSPTTKIDGGGGESAFGITLDDNCIAH
eukprot:CAMPEP_0115370514 /NCGR_PEP_ID=MMETSP0270-20121206/106871_1 /TAXON_ID=71861 /ORGANISM="Scrippsiella trochoidea, Strain CCMP3099" /LENGTH=102 /DNA_ID=CAMNT_0002793341 /DNA_START=1090 /DNA_END=1398 /DNA_ORIENTATION=+